MIVELPRTEITEDGCRSGAVPESETPHLDLSRRHGGCSISILSSNLFQTYIIIYIPTPPRLTPPHILQHHAHPTSGPSATSEHLRTSSPMGCLHHLSSRRRSNLRCDNLEVRKLSYELGRSGRSCEFVILLVYSGGDEGVIFWITMKKRFRIGEICSLAVLKHC